MADAGAELLAALRPLYANSDRWGDAEPVAGGHGGARLWRVATPDGALALRQWPAGADDALCRAHRTMDAAAAAGLEFVPALVRTVAGATRAEAYGRLHDVTAWLPGRPPTGSDDFAAAAAVALGRLHRSDTPVRSGPSRSLARRRRLWRLLSTRPPPSAPSADWVRLATRTDRLVERWRREVEEWLDGSPTMARTPVHGDAHAGNWLVQGGRIVGLVDWVAAGHDGPASDLARLFGSLLPCPLRLPAEWLAAYRGVAPLDTHEERRIVGCDLSGVLVACLRWRLWTATGAAPLDRWRALLDRFDDFG